MYHALLPPKTVKALKAEYHVRFFIVFVFFVSLAVLIAAVFLFPSYISSILGEKSAVAYAQSGKSGIATDTAVVTADLSYSNSLLSAISSFVSPELSPVILHLAALRPKGIYITSFDESYDGSASSTISIEGTADTRGDLVTFKSLLEGDQTFAGVQIPISDLTTASDIHFSIQLFADLSKVPKKQ